MIVSYARKFIFIKTKKTAGTTVEAVLATACAPGDVVTHPSDKYVGIGLEKFAGFFEEQKANSPEDDDDEREDKRQGRARGDFHNHMDAIDIRDRIDRVVRSGDYIGFRRWTIRGNVAVNDFIRHESLDADLARIGARLGFPIPSFIPQLKGHTRTDRRPAKEILSEDQKEIVYLRCREEFEILGYER